MLGRKLSAAAIAVVLLLGGASATSLGSFDDVALSATAEPVTACTADADLLDGLGNEILLGVNLSGITIEGVRLSPPEGDCAGMVPRVVVIGEDPPLTADKVLAVSDPIQGFDPAATLPQDRALSAGDPLLTLIDALDLLDVKRITELRVAFVPT